jgi:thiamine kinase-like enzyme
VTTNDVFLIDYDYTSFNYLAYDISNLVNETSLDYSPLTYPGFAIIKVYTEEELE